MRASTKGLLALGAGLVAGSAAAAGSRQVARNRRDAERLMATEGPTLPGGRVTTVRSPDGASIHAEVYGPEQAPTVVLVHGWTCSICFWHHQVRELSRDHRVVVFDKRGHGRTRRPESGDYSLEAQADELAAILAALVPEDSRAVLAGHSMGAMTIAALAERDAATLHARAAALAMLNTGVGDIISEALVIRGADRFGVLGERVGELVLSSRAPLALPESLLNRAVRYLALTPDAPDEAVALTAEMLRLCHPETRAACGESMTRMELYDALGSIELPTVVICGQRDKLTPPVHARRLAEELGGPVEVRELAGVGHMAALEAPEPISSLLRELAHNCGDGAGDRAAVVGAMPVLGAGAGDAARGDGDGRDRRGEPARDRDPKR
jgi:pimeloyl-ACP methyl ester carboxylesterase